MSMGASKENAIISKIPDMVDKVTDLLKKDDKKGDTKTEKSEKSEDKDIEEKEDN
jgi:hypothetical protein